MIRLPPLTLLAAALLVALPAGAQTGTIFHTGGGTSWSNPKTTLVVFRSGDTETQNLTIEAREWPATVTFGVGDGSGCTRSDGRWENGTWIPGTGKLAAFHNASGKYTGGTAIATACPHQGVARCSNDVTVNLSNFSMLGLEGERTFTANRGAPRCSDPQHQATRGTQTATGMFTVRIWGKLCRESPDNVPECWDLKNSTPPAVAFLSIVRRGGYRATFGPGPNCGPARTVAGLESQPPYAAWCDFTVKIAP